MRKLAVALLVTALAVPAALAGPGDPQKKLTKAGQAKAKRVSVTAADVGPTFKGTPSKQTDTGQPRCSAYSPDQSDLIEIGSHDSPDFQQGAGAFVSSNTGVFKTAAMARTGYARVARPQVAACFVELFARTLKKPQTLTSVKTGPLSFPRYGDRSNAYKIRATYSTGKTKAPFAIDIVLVNKGAVDVAFIFFGLGAPVSATFEQRVVSRVVARA